MTVVGKGFKLATKLAKRIKEEYNDSMSSDELKELNRIAKKNNTLSPKEKLNNSFQESFVDECTKIALFDKEPSVMEEAKTALDSMGMQGFYN